MDLDALSALGAGMSSMVETAERISTMKGSFARTHAQLMALAERRRQFGDTDEKPKEPPVYTEADIPGVVEALTSADDRVFYKVRRDQPPERELF